MFKKAIIFILRLPAVAAVFLINCYQATLSPDHGMFKALYPYGYCKHFPSCSEYTKLKIQKNGFLAGGAAGFIRILKCNPWTESKVETI